MALVVKDRVRETSVTQGTGTFTLAGAVTGYQSFSAIGNGNTTYYTIYLQASNEWEVGIGTYTASGTTLSRDTILASSNGGAVVNFSAGTKDVFVTYPAGRSVYYDTATNVTVNQLSATTVDATNVEVTNIKALDGTAAASIANSTGAVTVSTLLNVDNLRLDGNTLSSTDSNGNVVLAPNGTGDVQLDADTVRIGDSNANATITTNGTGDLILNTNSGTNSGSITIEDGVNGNIIIAPNGTGQVQITNAALDLTTIEVSNINAKDGTAAITIADSTGAVGISTAVTMSATTQNIALGTSQTTGTFTVGGAAQTGTQTFDQSTKTHTLNLGTGATESGLTKTINIGTAGVSGSTTTITIGSANGTSTTLNGTVTAATFNSTTIDTTNIEVTNIKAKDGTAALSIADSTGVVSITANPVLSGGTANGVLYLNASKVATSGSALTFDGTNLGIGATPSSKLDLGGTVSSTEQIRFSMGGNVAWIGSVGSGTANGLGNLTFWTRDGSSAVVRYQIDGSGQSIWSVAGSEQMRLTSTGLGIGESNPAVRLDVLGQGRVLYNTGATNTGDQNAVTVGATTSGAYASSYGAGLQFQVTNSGGGYAGGRIVSRLGADNFTANLVFQARNYGYTDSMTLDASGNLVVGTTGTAQGRVHAHATTNAQFVATDATLGDAYGGVFRGYGVGAAGGYAELGVLDNGTFTKAIQVQQQATVIAFFTGVNSAGNAERARITSGGSLELKRASNSAQNSVVFNTTVQDALTLDSSGNLGLGIAPSAWGTSSQKAIEVILGALSYRGAGNTESTVTHGAYYDGTNWKYAATSVGAARYQMIGANAGSSHTWSVSAGGTKDNTISFTQAMTLDASGNLGLGTTTLTNSGGYATFNINGSTGGQIAFQTGGTSKQYIYSTSTDLNFYNSQTGNLIFYTTSTECARITSVGGFETRPAANGHAVFNEDGVDADFRVEGDTDANLLFVDASTDRVGIGTNAPAAKLDVNGNANIGSTSSVDTALFVKSSTVTGLVGAQSNYSAWSSGGLTTAMNIGTTTNNGISFGTNNIGRLNLDSSGNLGLGVTPSAWNSQYKVLQVGASSALWGTNGYTFLSENVYSNSSDVPTYINTGNNATMYRMDTGAHKWYTAPSGTAGNAITFTQAMTLDASGRWLLGTTTGVGNDFTSIRFNSSSSYPQGLNMVDANASASGSVFQVFRKSDDTYLGNIRRNSTDNALYIGGNSYLALGSGDTERARITSVGGFETRPAANGHAVFNEDGVDADFRVESDANTHALFVEATNSNVKIGGSAERATTVGTNHLDIFDGTAPVGTLANGISIYSSSGEAYVMDAAGNATLFSPHDAETNEWIFKSKHTPTGKTLKIDVEKLLRFINDHFGLDAVHEFIEE